MDSNVSSVFVAEIVTQERRSRSLQFVRLEHLWILRLPAICVQIIERMRRSHEAVCMPPASLHQREQVMYPVQDRVRAALLGGDGWCGMSDGNGPRLRRLGGKTARG